MTRFSYRQAKTIFVVCEGASEQGYMRALNKRLHRVRITTFDANGGSAAAVIENGLADFAKRKALGQVFDAAFALLDREPPPKNPAQLARAVDRAQKQKFNLIWQSGTHEEFLRVHFEEESDALPLEHFWRGYRKGLDAREYERILGDAHYARAGRRLPELAAFFAECGVSYAAGA